MQKIIQPIFTSNEVIFGKTGNKGNEIMRKR